MEPEPKTIYICQICGDEFEFKTSRNRDLYDIYLKVIDATDILQICPKCVRKELLKRGIWYALDA